MTRVLLPLHAAEPVQLREIAGATTRRRGGTARPPVADEHAGACRRPPQPAGAARRAAQAGAPFPARGRPAHADAFGDHATLRRELVEMKLLARKPDCSEYRKLSPRPADEVRALIQAWRAAFAA